jgi:hypothetical protein
MKKSRKDQVATGAATTWKQALGGADTAVFRLADGRYLTVRPGKGDEGYTVTNTLTAAEADRLLSAPGVRCVFSERAELSSDAEESESARSAARPSLRVLR